MEETEEIIDHTPGLKRVIEEMSQADIRSTTFRYPDANRQNGMVDINNLEESTEIFWKSIDRIIEGCTMELRFAGKINLVRLYGNDPRFLPEDDDDPILDPLVPLRE